MMYLAIAVGLFVLVLGVRLCIIRVVELRDARRFRGSNGVTTGAEAFQLSRAGAPGVLLLHGAGDSPQSMRLLGEYLYAQGFAVMAPLLPGHGQRVQNFRHVDAAQWRDAALDAYDAFAAEHPWTGVVGLSMGGALAAITAAERSSVGALVLLAPYVELPGMLRVAAAASPMIGLFSPYFSSGDPRSIRDPGAANRGIAYRVFTPAALRALRDTARSGWASLVHIHAPTLIVQSRADNRIAPDVPVRALQRLGAADKHLEWVSDGGHVITVDFGKERVFALADHWLKAHGAAALLRS